MTCQPYHMRYLGCFQTVLQNSGMLASVFSNCCKWDVWFLCPYKRGNSVHRSSPADQSSEHVCQKYSYWVRLLTSDTPPLKDIKQWRFALFRGNGMPGLARGLVFIDFSMQMAMWGEGHVEGVAEHCRTRGFLKREAVENHSWAWDSVAC